MDLGIQIVNYNTKKYLKDCLASLLSDLRSCQRSYEINVLDNASQDYLADLQEFYSGSKVRFYFSDKNLGFGGGHNFLARHTRAKYLLILNPDILFIENNTVQRLLDRLADGAKTAVVGPQLLTSRGTIQYWDHGELGLIARIIQYFSGGYWCNKKKLTRARWVSGAVF